MHRISDDQRRARLAARHGVGRRVGSVEEAVRAMTCLHATEPPSVYLSAFARADVTRADVDRALYEDRSIVKQLAMRRTLFAFPREALPAVWGSASARVAGQLGTRLAKEVEGNGLDPDGAGWVRRRQAEVLSTLRREGPSTTAELRERLPQLARRVEMAPGKTYGGSFPIAPRLLSSLAAGGQVVRGTNAGDWRLSRPRWTATEQWLGQGLHPETAESGYLALVADWLHTFGPGTENDLVWWLGATKTIVRRALAQLRAVEVFLEAGPGRGRDPSTGWVLPEDLDDVPEPDPWAALLPVLDPTTMGWKERAFHLDPADAPFLFDANGNAGTTAWWNGRVVGCWVQDEGGVVQVSLRHDLGGEAVAALGVEAERLTTWLAGQRVPTVYTSPQMKAAR